MKLVIIGILAVTISADISHDVRKYYAGIHDLRKYNDVYNDQYLLPKRLDITRGVRDADTSLEAAKVKCEKFYNDRSEGAQGTSTTPIGGGGQSRVYKCETNDGSSLVPVVAIKMYMRPWEV